VASSRSLSPPTQLSTASLTCSTISGALWPEASEVHNHLGLAYVRAGRDDHAEAAFRRAVELDCDNEAAEHNLRAARAGRLRPPDASAEVSRVP